MYSFLKPASLRPSNRVEAAVDKMRLREFVASLSSKQRVYLVTKFSELTHNWLTEFVEGRTVKNVNPHLNLANTWKAQDLQDFIIAWAHLRTVSPPAVGGQTIYRLSAITRYPDADRVIFNNESQLKAATSWTLRKNPKVQSRYAQKNMVDVVLEYKLEGTKHVLFDFLSARNLFLALEKDLDFYTNTYKELVRHWGKGNNLVGYALDYLKDFSFEKEVVIYLNKGENLECKWRKA
jgi:hypothetical protein